jgi:hypothetical protein
LIVASQREILGHALDQPERQSVEPHQSAARRPLGDVVLEDVHQLVAEHVIVVGVDAGERHDHARAIRLRDAARSFLELLADDVRLLEIGVVGVEDQRLSIERVTKRVRMPRVPALGHSTGVANDRRLRPVEEVIEVLRLQDFPVEAFVLDFVASKIVLGA